jgi:chemosensory pili system protein ChpA (sensor histidine kinase/response regulator)
MKPEHSEEPLPDRYYYPEIGANILEHFIPEAQEYLENISLCLLRLEKEPKSKDTIEQLFRAAHTLKGSAFTVGFQVIGDLTHHMEDIMGSIRNGRLHVTAELTDVFFCAVDEVRLLLGRDPAQLSQIRREFDPIMQRLRQASSGREEKSVTLTAKFIE